MNIAFTGINNLHIGKKQYSKIGSYIDHDKKIKQGENNYTIIKISADLTDDQKGKDLTDFKNTLAKCKTYYQKNCINPKNPNHIDLIVTKKETKTSKGKLDISLFQLNDQEILIHEREILPLLTFLAKFTRKIASSETTSEGQKYYANLANQSIHTEAVNFIENEL